MIFKHPSISKNASISLLALVLALLIGAVYLNSINSPFHFDDNLVIKNNYRLSSISNLRYLFKNPEYFKVARELTFRPIITAQYFFFKLVFKNNPAPWRIFNLLVHFGVCLLLFELLRLFQVSNRIAFLSASLFAVHPVHTEIFNVVAFNEDLIGSFFCLLAFYGYLQKGRAWRLGSLAAYLICCFTKETFVLLPIIILIYEWWQRERPLSWGNFFFSQLGYLIIAVLFLYVNRMLMKNPGSLKAAYPGGTLLSALLTFSVVLKYYLKIFFIPTGLTPIYDFPVFKSILNRPVMASLAVLLLISTIIIYGFKNKKKYAFFLIWFFLFLLPTSNIIPFWMILAERYLYFPLLGLIPGVILLGKQILEKINVDWWKPTLILGIIFLSFFSIMTVKRNSVWQDPEKDRKSTRLNSSHILLSRMPSSA